MPAPPKPPTLHTPKQRDRRTPAMHNYVDGGGRAHATSSVGARPPGWCACLSPCVCVCVHDYRLCGTRTRMPINAIAHTTPPPPEPPQPAASLGPDDTTARCTLRPPTQPTTTLPHRDMCEFVCVKLLLPLWGATKTSRRLGIEAESRSMWARNSLIPEHRTRGTRAGGWFGVATTATAQQFGGHIFHVLY